MNSVQSNSQICYCGSSSPIMMPERVMTRFRSIDCTTSRGQRIFSFQRKGKARRRHRESLERTFRKWLPLSQRGRKNQTKCQYPSHGVSSTLMSKNFSRRNVLKHNNKLKQNRKCSNINQQLQQNEVFKPLQNQKTRTMQKQQHQIKNRMNRVFRSHHLKDTHQSTCCNQSERLTHLFCFLEKGQRQPCWGRQPHLGATALGVRQHH